MEGEKDAFYVVKKGDVIGVYRSLRDLHAQTVNDPSLIVYKGYGLTEQAEAYLGSCGLKNTAYSLSASDVNDKTFGKLVPCLPQEVGGSTSLFADPRMKHINLANQVETQMMPFNCQSYIVEFDGASKGNPGPAGAGAVLRAADGRVVCRLHEGVGIATNNVAEYRGAILGMKCALKKGFKHVRVQGDSNLVCMQVQGRWKIKSQNLVELNKQAMELKDKFVSFQINHVVREFNSEADALANQGVNLMNGQVQEDWIM
ncbi:uncharacterized protein LOC110427944 isoform X3 [Herrania umbratica]|uniref:Uncharacterized protein LOC110427944 isoform X3 n=1 Tax=Herrania umbratica TaxID=108875 RepID=A0A6J1BJJ8_9ROSI|nr:uncharacterized protein LOC110427944 isoform X3 [Herrania umbratica]